MPRGRPVGSKVRQNIVEILHHCKEMHGYNVYAIYKDIFPKVTMRAIYYHLKKGIETKEFKVTRIKKESGEYSWGGEVERIYYSLGPEARPQGNRAVKDYLDSKAEKEAKKQNQVTSA